MTPSSYCARDNYTLFQLQREFFRNAVMAPDQLRQRVAFALSQILVVSGTEINQAYAMQRYQQMLADLAFDNFRNVLTQVTLSPAMGNYLDMANNAKPNAATGVEPNENYAREVMQLFAIGTVELKPDGTPLTDAGGKRVATYDQDEIEGYAHVFTGWTYPTAAGAAPRNGNNPQYFDGADGAALAIPRLRGEGAARRRAARRANLTMNADLANAIDSIFMHPNVGPFIGKQLIQKLVTGNPSPAYVARIAAVFNDNGAGVRGDLKAVVRAILLDPEARGADDRRRDLRPAARARAVRRRSRPRAQCDDRRRLLPRADERDGPAGVRRAVGVQFLSAGLRDPGHRRAGPRVRAAEHDHRLRAHQLRERARLRPRDRTRSNRVRRHRHAIRLERRSRRSPATPRRWSPSSTAC